MKLYKTPCCCYSNTCASHVRDTIALVVAIACIFFAEYFCEKLILPCIYSKIIQSIGSIILSITLTSQVRKFLSLPQN